MEQNGKYTRKQILGYTALGLASLLQFIDIDWGKNISKLMSPLESTVAQAPQTVYFNSTKNIDGEEVQAYELADKIAEALKDSNIAVQRKKGPHVFAEISDRYQEVIDDAKRLSEGDDWGSTRQYSGLEIIARMWRAKMTSELGANIVTGPMVSIDGIPNLYQNHKVGSNYIVNNLLKALQDYERVEEIWHEAAKQGKKFPDTVGIRVLGDNGRIATLDTVYKRMVTTLERIDRQTNGRYSDILTQKISQIRAKQNLAQNS